MATSLDISLDENLNQWGLCFMLYTQNSAYWCQDIAPWNVFGFLYKKKFKHFTEVQICLLPYQHSFAWTMLAEA